MSKNTLFFSLLMAAVLSSCSSTPKQNDNIVAEQEPSIEDLLVNRAIAQAQGLEVYGVKALTKLISAAAPAAKQELNVLIRQAAQSAGIKLVSGKSLVSQLDDASANKILKQLFAANPGLRNNSAYAEVETGLEAALKSRQKTEGYQSSTYVDGAEFRELIKKTNEGLGNHAAKRDVLSAQIAVHHNTGVELISNPSKWCAIFKKFDVTAATNNVKLYKALGDVARGIGKSGKSLAQRAQAMYDEGACTIAQFMTGQLNVAKAEVIPTAETLVASCNSYNPRFLDSMRKSTFPQTCNY